MTCERPRVCSCPSWKQREQSSCSPHGSVGCPFEPLSRPKGSGSERAGQAAQSTFLSGTLCSGPLGSFQLTYPDRPPWLCGEGVTPSTDGKVEAGESQSAESAGGSLLLQMQIPTGRLWCGEAGPWPFFFLDTSLGHSNSQERRGNPSKLSGLELWPCCMLSQPNH